MDYPQAQSQEPHGIWQKTLNIAGFGYVLGDLAMIGASLMRAPADKRRSQFHGEAKGGAAWMLGGLGAMAFGNPDTDTQLRIQAHKLEAHLKSKGAQVNDAARNGSPLLAARGPWQLFKDFCHEHPSEILNAGYAVGAGMLLHQGVKERFFDHTKKLLPGALDVKSMKNAKGVAQALAGSVKQVSTPFWMGTLVMAGALIGLFAKEDPEARQKAEGGTLLDKTVAFVREKPLRVAAGCYMLNNAFLGIRAAQDWSLSKETRVMDAKGTVTQEGYGGQRIKPHWFSGAQLGLYVMSNLMLMASSRDQMSKNGFDAHAQERFEEAAALLVMAQPPEAQRTLLKQTSEYMAKQSGVTLDAATIEQHLVARITQLTQARLTAVPSQQSASR